MVVDEPGSSLEARRRETLAQLESLHGTRTIGAEEYRQRAEVARRARDEAELESVEPAGAELAAPPARPMRPDTHAPAPAPAAAPAPARAPTAPAAPRVPAGEQTGVVLAVLSGATRKGPWEPPETLYAVGFLGGVELDFRQAALLEGVTEVKALALMGGVDIIVPDDVDVEVSGFGFMGGFDHVSQHLPGGDRPLVRISGLALMGGVSVKVKPMPEPSRMERLAKRVRDLV